ncbi:hypothetical protein BEL04_15035 [Mucilaginibacter sp. PPCGB 2223]|uniref:hypothetical protein n=1 Tax=Mucilaginibacter sp. PPCGB 2223 TaxID=1886027 RepID=UPI000824BA15|nr:hypothetical protein [Mucilaginibacter sp. PPCGB 2223]OCX51343.1 hypothetical protein BEL04_15035 [Mucilaginibacter sp. PPCGB 2223]
METPKKPLKKSAGSAGAKKSADKPEAKPKSRFVDDDDDDEFDNTLDDLSAYESFDGLEEDDDY